MARKVRNSLLENRTQRLKLPVAKKPIFTRIGPGISIGYRRNQAVGTWVLRVADGRGGARTAAIGFADDHDDADGEKFLDYWQAQDRAKAAARQGNADQGRQPLTIRAVAETYLQWLTAKNPRTAADTRGRLEKHFLPKFGDRLVSGLTKSGLDGWLASMVTQSDNPERVRKSKDSANRVLSMVKAFLNHAVRDPANGLTDDSAWRLVRPFHGASKPRDVRYTGEQVQRLVAGASDEGVARLVTGAFLTGARFGELAELRVRQFDSHSRTLRIIAGKTGARTVVLQRAAADFLSRISEGRDPDDFLFSRPDGRRWKKSDQTRPIKDALRAAGLSTEGSLYALRHTYISQAIEGGVPLNIIAENCGTSVRMIEKTYAKILAEKRREFIEIGAPRL
jgi:integrase